MLPFLTDNRLTRWCFECAMCCGRSADGEFYGELDDSGDRLLWSLDLGAHSAGEFSHAVVQANAPIEDHSLVEVADGAIFVGVFDGHGGDAASVFVRDELFLRFNRLAKENSTINENVLREAIAETEAAFIDLVCAQREANPNIKSAGTCCLAGVLWRGTLYVANLGDSRVVIGRTCPSGGLYSEQLTNDDNCRRSSIRLELRAANPYDHNIVYYSGGSWRVRGISQVSRSIGDAFLKDREFAFPYGHRFFLNQQLPRPSLSAIPRLHARKLWRNDLFLIFASDGLWDLISNRRAVKIVRDSPRHGIARRLIEAAIKEAAWKTNQTYSDLRQLGAGNRRNYHDEISVVVVFIDGEALGQKRLIFDPLSVSGFASGGPLPGNFDLGGIH